MQFIPLCSDEMLEEGQSLGFDLANNVNVFVTKKHDQIFVYENKCPHLGIRLEWQENQFLDSDRALIECSMHGALFEIDTGKCIVGPCQGRHLTQIEHNIQDGQIVIAMPETKA